MTTPLSIRFHDFMVRTNLFSIALAIAGVGMSGYYGTWLFHDLFSTPETQTFS